MASAEVRLPTRVSGGSDASKHVPGGSTGQGGARYAASLSDRSPAPLPALLAAPAVLLLPPLLPAVPLRPAAAAGGLEQLPALLLPLLLLSPPRSGRTTVAATLKVLSPPPAAECATMSGNSILHDVHTQQAEYTAWHSVTSVAGHCSYARLVSTRLHVAGRETVYLRGWHVRLSQVLSHMRRAGSVPLWTGGVTAQTGNVELARVPIPAAASGSATFPGHHTAAASAPAAATSARRPAASPPPARHVHNPETLYRNLKPLKDAEEPQRPRPP